MNTMSDNLNIDNMPVYITDLAERKSITYWQKAYELKTTKVDRIIKNGLDQKKRKKGLKAVTLNSLYLALENAQKIYIANKKNNHTKGAMEKMETCIRQVEELATLRINEVLDSIPDNITISENAKQLKA